MPRAQIIVLVALSASPLPAIAQDDARIFVRPVDPAVDLATTPTATFEVVLDVTDLASEFFAFNQYDFDLRITAAGEPIPLSQVTDFADQPSATAPTTGFDAQGAPWTGGRRPGAFPNSGFSAGGSQQGPYGAEIVELLPDGVRLTSGFDHITGRQAAFASPENNVLINQSRAYEAFRVTIERTPANGEVTIALSDTVLNIYPDAGSAFNRFLDGFTTESLTIPALIPSPSAIALAALAAPMVARRRRR